MSITQSRKNIIRVEHSKHYTCIANEAIRDKRLSLKARGLHHLLLSYPDNWQVSVKHLSEEASDRDQRTAIQGALKELEKFGYLTKEVSRGKKGQITGCEYVVRELPQPQTGCPQTGCPQAGCPQAGFPPAGFPLTDNQYLISTKEKLITELKETPIPSIVSQGTKGTKETKEFVCVPENVEIKSAEPCPSSGLPSLKNQPTLIEESKPVLETKKSAGACDNKTTDSSQHPVAKCEALFQGDKTPWFEGRGLNSWHKGFVEFYRSYLSSTPRYMQALNREATEGEARNSLIALTRSEEGQATIENHWGDYKRSLPSEKPAQRTYVAGPDLLLEAFAKLKPSAEFKRKFPGNGKRK